MKKVLGIVIVLSLVSCVGFAAPLNDFSQGKVAVDLSVRLNNNIDVRDPGPYTENANTYWDYGLTVGLGKNFALEYKNSNPKTNDNYDMKLDIQELNVLYQLDQNFTAFTGINRVKSNYPAWGDRSTSSTNWQLGITGQTALADKFTGYATIAAGKDTNVYKLGVAYAVNNNLDVDLFYAWNKYKDVEFNPTWKEEYTVKGLGLGVTYKF